eukprot:TRINITY_DN738_c0_g1_i7.p7 TRINITY_DN738_c0_g1~~TRINITY_DN738_c0_g1_i7.p7  ORF type:complete len:222 (+),score=32.69 TRINITY_DN738_c0_g1_i7:4567-5232(+)
MANKEVPMHKGAPVIMKQHVLDKRAGIIKERLMKLTFKKHYEHLVELNQTDYDPIEKHSWHATFKMDNIELNESIQLKPKPLIQGAETVREYIKKNDIQKIKVQAALDSLSKENSESPVKDSAPSYLSQKLLRKIKIKEKVLTECKKEIADKVESTEQKNKQFQLSHLVETLKSIFTTQRGPTAPLENVVDKLRDTERGLFISRGTFCGDGKANNKKQRRY